MKVILILRARYFFPVLLLFLTVVSCNAQTNKIVFKKIIIYPAFVSEGAAVADINNDGRKDIVAGNLWYEAPDWKAHLLHTDTADHIPGYSTTFINLSLDVNNDGWQDVMRFDEPGGLCTWYENPGKANLIWNRHIIIAKAGNESPTLADVDKDGKLDLLCNDPTAKKMIWFKSPSKKNDTIWIRNIISNDSLLGTDRYTHGLGWADMNGDGRNDVIIRKGWWETPVDATKPDWTFHPANLGKDCANMFAFDADGDGDMDVFSSSAHNYGVWWHEQQKNEKGDPAWITHVIDSSFSQSHALRFEDIDNDGNPDLITGKRYLAHHNGSDAGSFEPAVLYWFEFVPGKNPKWIAHEIDNNSGVGNSFVVDDIDNDGLKDIIVSNKKGVFLFRQAK